MKLKKLVSVLLVGAMVASLAACGGNDKKPAAGDTAEENKDPIKIWTFTEDLKTYAEEYTKQTGIEVELNIIPTADYPTKLQTAMDAQECDADIIVGEPQMLDNFFDAGYFADLDEFGAGDYEGKIVDYVWERGKDADGVQRAISYQITPAGFFYRADIAKEVFGTDDPETIKTIFTDYNKIMEAGNTLKAAGYRIFASDSEVGYFSGDEAWVVDGKLNVAKCRTDYMDLVVELYQKDLTAYAAQWATPWYQAMAGEVPVLTAATQWGNDDLNIWQGDSQEAQDAFNEVASGVTGETTQVFAFGLPSWGSLILRDHVGDTTKGQFRFCPGPSNGFGGGTYVGISADAKNPQGAWQFLKWVTLNEETADWWIEKSEGDAVSLISALEKHADDENPVFGGEHMYKYYLEIAKGIDYTLVTRYDGAIGDAWGKAISAIKTGEKSKDDAIAEFYDEVESLYAGEITVER